MQELQQDLAELGLPLDMAEAEGVCKCWDRDGSGTLDLEEFLRASPFTSLSRGCRAQWACV